MKNLNVLITVGYPDDFVSDFGDRHLFGVITEKVNIDDKNVYLCNCTKFKVGECEVRQLVLQSRYVGDEFDIEKQKIVTANCCFSTKDIITSKNIESFCKNDVTNWLVAQVEIKPILPKIIQEEFEITYGFIFNNAPQKIQLDDCFTIDEEGLISAKDEKSLFGSIIIPKNINGVKVRGIKDFGFRNCVYINSVEIPTDTKIIGKNAFDYCINLNSIKLPNSLEIIDNLAFQFCINLKELVIPNSVFKIGQYAFSYCLRLSNIELSFSLKLLEPYLFFKCYNLSEVYIPDSVKEIGGCVFGFCNNLKKIVIPNSVTVIRESSFSNCSNLTEITIPLTVVEIGYGIF